ncbi:unnamed protein product [Caenorhabditis bovis]|uniref:Uncharacterized protein n=1 Tax=Caenorhabditis bovis TaxID=2654633 RepID=A0A8S1EF53_9PELO|nr:unnamed protein product [Caenorhabditis bovis]CAB3398435.1 unnamed protein product [Caenorhabditis bovis]CAB3398436.1 unnamed protein product [Caenorhabditis bovis]CAB3398437.1 unnamed protein product [Caenorhabditis bovis]CAB3398438.1 unnamed protein product [Caenorhabditis bovis]
MFFLIHMPIVLLNNLALVSKHGVLLVFGRWPESARSVFRLSILSCWWVDKLLDTHVISVGLLLLSIQRYVVNNCNEKYSKFVSGYFLGLLLLLNVTSGFYYEFRRSDAVETRINTYILAYERTDSYPKTILVKPKLKILSMVEMLVD